jgi:hypothetical protein
MAVVRLLRCCLGLPRCAVPPFCARVFDSDLGGAQALFVKSPRLHRHTDCIIVGVTVYGLRPFSDQKSPQVAFYPLGLGQTAASRAY